MPSITFGCVTTFKHRGEQSEIKIPSCPVNRSHNITSGNFCPECGSLIFEKTEKHIVYKQTEIENLIKQTWGDLHQKYREELFYYVQHERNAKSSTVLLYPCCYDGTKVFFDTVMISSGINADEIAKLSGLATECFHQIAKLIDREHSEICMGADIQYYD